MVKREGTVYLFIGEDIFSKDAKLKKIKEEFLSKDIESFNLDVLYARELTLNQLQEKLLCLPVKSKKRVIVIKDLQYLKEDARDFMLNYVKSPMPYIVLVLDVNRYDYKDDFLRRLLTYSQVYRFKESIPQDTFSLSRQIELKRPDYALRVLNQLLKNGERPERILGGLRYSLLKNAKDHFETRKRLKLLLNCDLDIKMGRLKPALALERFVVVLCCLDKPAR